MNHLLCIEAFTIRSLIDTVKIAQHKFSIPFRFFFSIYQTNDNRKKGKKFLNFFSDAILFFFPPLIIKNKTNQKQSIVNQSIQFTYFIPNRRHKLMSINNNNNNIYDVYVDIFKFGCYLKRKYTFFYQKKFFFVEPISIL